MRASGDVVEAIGNTPMVQLRKVIPSGSARVFAKIEFVNPTGSMKDRVAKPVVETAAADGRLKPGRRSSSILQGRRESPSPWFAPPRALVPTWSIRTLSARKSA